MNSQTLPDTWKHFLIRDATQPSRRQFFFCKHGTYNMNLTGQPSNVIRPSKLEALYYNAQSTSHETILAWVIYSTHSLGECQGETEIREGLSGMGFAASQIDGPIEDLSHRWHLKSTLACFVFSSPEIILEVHRGVRSREQPIACDGHDIWDLLVEMQQQSDFAEKGKWRKRDSDSTLRDYIARNAMWEILNDK